MGFIDILIGKRIVDIGRASNLLWIIFENESGEKYSLHVQSTWRVFDKKCSTIVLASGDIYEPNSQMEYDDSFDWDVKGNNMFDGKKYQVFPKEEKIYVKEVFMNDVNDLHILFSNDLLFECYIDISFEEECWRFFKQGASNAHYVVGNGFIEIVE